MKKAARSILSFVLIAGTFMAGAWYNQRTAARSGATSNRRVLYYMDPMHPTYKSDRPGIAPDCGMELVAVYADERGGAFAATDNSFSAPAGTVAISSDKQQLIGVRVTRVEKASGTGRIRLFGRVSPDETRIYKLNAGIDGSIREVSSFTTGSQVKKDQLLATFVAPDFVAAIQSYIIALNATDRLKQSGTNISTQIDPVTGNPTNTNFQQRLEKLENMGMSAVQIEEIGRTREIPKTIKILAPANGFVLARNVSAGLKFDRGAELYRIADLRRVWILADVFGQEARMVRSGTTARISLPDQNLVFHAKVSEVLPQFDPGSRSLKVRLEMDNPGYALRPDMFVDVDLPITFPSTIAVPVDAILDSGLRKTVFVDRGEGFFEPRQVETGSRFDDRVEIVKGLMPGERIVVAGNFLLDSESRLKAGTTARSTPAGDERYPAGPGVMRAEASSQITSDPACGMNVDKATAIAAGRTSKYRDQTYYFCSDSCKHKFDTDASGPLKEVAVPPAEQRPARATGAARRSSALGGRRG